MSLKQLALAQRYSAVAIGNTIILFAEGETPSSQTAIWLEQGPEDVEPAIHYLYWVPGWLPVVSPFKVRQSFQVSALPRSITVVDLAGSHQVHVRPIGLPSTTADSQALTAEAASLPLAGTSWQLTEFVVGRQQIPVIDGTRITLDFDDRGGVSGSGGCNTYFGSYFASGDSIDIGPMGSTRMFCPEPPGRMEQEQLYFQGLEAAETFTADGKGLRLFWQDGERALRFRALEK